MSDDGRMVYDLQKSKQSEIGQLPHLNIVCEWE